MIRHALSSIRRHVAALAAAAALAGAPGAACAHGAKADPPIFGAVAVESHTIQLFPKWTWMWRRYRREAPRETAPCTPNASPRSCALQRWRKYLDEIKGMSRMDQLRMVNRFANYARYVTDPVNYHVADYWATPLQFLKLDGDCEDYAITKYLSLRTLGFPDADLRLVVLQDMNLGVAHAVLVVFLNGVAWLLDNQVPDVVRADTIHHYRPIYALNQTSWWLLRTPGKGPYLTAAR